MVDVMMLLYQDQQKVSAMKDLYFDIQKSILIMFVTFTSNTSDGIADIFVDKPMIVLS